MSFSKRLFAKYKNELNDWHKDKSPAFIKDIEVSSYGGGRLSETLNIVADYMELWKLAIKNGDRFIRSIGGGNFEKKYGEFREPCKAPLIINMTKGFPSLDNEEDVLFEIEKLRKYSEFIESLAFLKNAKIFGLDDVNFDLIKLY